MSFSKKTLSWGTVALGLVLASGLTWYATTARSCDGNGSKTSATNENGSSDIRPVSTDASGGCPMMKAGAGGCCGGAKAMAGGACCEGAKGTAISTAAAGSMFPEGTTVTRVEVKGGVDLIFTGKDLVAIKKVVDDHIKTCSATMKSKGKSKCPVCTVASNDISVVLQVRGSNPAQCCEGMMQANETQITPNGASVTPTSTATPVTGTAVTKS